MVTKIEKIKEKLKEFINKYGVSALTFEDIDRIFKLNKEKSKDEKNRQRD